MILSKPAEKAKRKITPVQISNPSNPIVSKPETEHGKPLLLTTSSEILKQTFGSEEQYEKTLKPLEELSKKIKKLFSEVEENLKAHQYIEIADHIEKTVQNTNFYRNYDLNAYFSFLENLRLKINSKTEDAEDLKSYISDLTKDFKKLLIELNKYDIEKFEKKMKREEKVKKPKAKKISDIRNLVIKRHESIKDVHKLNYIQLLRVLKQKGSISAKKTDETDNSNLSSHPQQKSKAIPKNILKKNRFPPQRDPDPNVDEKLITRVYEELESLFSKKDHTGIINWILNEIKTKKISFLKKNCDHYYNTIKHFRDEYLKDNLSKQEIHAKETIDMFLGILKDEKPTKTKAKKIRDKNKEKEECENNTDKIFNVETGRCVSRKGKIGRKIMGLTKSSSKKSQKEPKENCNSEQLEKCDSMRLLCNPKTGKCVDPEKKLGRKLQQHMQETDDNVKSRLIHLETFIKEDKYKDILDWIALEQENLSSLKKYSNQYLEKIKSLQKQYFQGSLSKSQKIINDSLKDFIYILKNIDDFLNVLNK